MDISFLDKFGDFVVAGTLGGLGYVWHKIVGNEKALTLLALKIAENYVTKPELQRVEDKIDGVGIKIDNVNQNLILLLKEKING